MSTSDDISDKESWESENSDLESNSDLSDTRDSLNASLILAIRSTIARIQPRLQPRLELNPRIQVVTLNVALTSEFQNQSKNRSASVHWPLYPSSTHPFMKVRTYLFLTAIFFYTSIT